MSVIVKGMEMPKQGWKCPLNGGGVCKLESLSCGKYIPALCPLRPLPEKHGRLIDIDALPQTRVEWEDIVDAPIVVEAGGDGD